MRRKGQGKQRDGAEDQVSPTADGCTEGQDQYFRPKWANSAWREQILGWADEVETLDRHLAAESKTRGDVMSDGGKVFDEAVKHHLAVARDIAGSTPLIWRWRGPDIVRAYHHVDDAEVCVYRRAPTKFVEQDLPVLWGRIKKYLPPDEPARVNVQGLLGKPLRDDDKETVVAALEAANEASRGQFSRVRSFRLVVHVTAGVLFAIAIVVGAVGKVIPEAVPLCFSTPAAANSPEVAANATNPTNSPNMVVVCPTNQTLVPAGKHIDDVIAQTVSGNDLWLVESLGIAAAALVGAIALRNIRGTSTPYSVPVALTVLKLPSGALTAFLGLLLMRGGFVPGLSALDTPAQILSWAVVFGAAQQLFTRFVDTQAQNVLGSVGNKDQQDTSDTKDQKS